MKVHFFYFKNGDGEIRTLMALRPLAPEASASTNSATSPNNFSFLIFISTSFCFNIPIFNISKSV